MARWKGKVGAETPSEDVTSSGGERPGGRFGSDQEMRAWKAALEMQQMKKGLAAVACERLSLNGTVVKMK